MLTWRLAKLLNIKTGSRPFERKIAMESRWVHEWLGSELADYFRLIIVDHRTVDHAGFTRAPIIDMNASARFHQVLVDLFANVVHVTNRLVEHEAKSIVPAFRADHDYFPWLIRGSDQAGASFHRRCSLSGCLLLCSRRRARLREINIKLHLHFLRVGKREPLRE